MDLEAMVALGVSLDDKVTKIHDRLTKSMVPRPIRRRFGGSSVAVAGQVTNIPCFPICAEGRMWVLRKIAIFGSDVHTPLSGSAQQTNVVGNPAAGSNAVYTNTTGAPQVISAVRFTFTASATVANRFPEVIFQDASANQLFEQTDLTAVVASTSLIMFLAQGIGTAPNAASGTVIGGLPTSIVLPPNGTLTIGASGIAAGDTVTNIVVTTQTITSVTADLYAGSAQDETSSDFTGIIASAVTIPTIKDYGNRHLTLYSMDQVYALVTGAATGQSLVLTGEADEYKIEEVEAQHT